jgi:hypothetical protein
VFKFETDEARKNFVIITDRKQRLEVLRNDLYEVLRIKYGTQEVIL